MKLIFLGWMMKKTELLAPAGDLEKLKVAIEYGADAVYCSDRFFGLRGKAGNFTLRQMKEGVQYAHDRGRKVYTAVNIFAYNRDFRRIEDYLKILHHEIKVDAIIVTDPGVIDLAREVVPDLELHLSTQANTLNARACSFWHKQGVSRVILAREVSFPDIQKICLESPTEIEIFVHGSICIAYSGRCFISNYMSQYRDANRGLCTNSCRWEYKVHEKEVDLEEKERPDEKYSVVEDQRGTYFFNSKDLSLVRRLDDVLSTGLSSIKIEGRTKSLSYLSTVVAVYRQAMDAYYRDINEYKERVPEFLTELSELGSRGYTEGLFRGPQKTTDYNLEGHQKRQHFDFAGLLKQRDNIRGEDMALVTMKKKIVPGDEIKIYHPSLVHETRKIEGIFSPQGNFLQKAIPGQEVYLKGLEGIPLNTILRMDLPQPVANR